MHTHSIEPWQHPHVFLGAKHDRHERRTWFVVALTAVMMVAEIVGGTIFGSMAVVADGWHMSTHAGALAIAALAYRFARRHARDARFTFGTGKVGELAAFCSAVILALIAAAIGYEALMRLYAPVAIHFERGDLRWRWSALASIWRAPGCCSTRIIITARMRMTTMITTTMTMSMHMTMGIITTTRTIPISARLTCTCSPTP